MNGVRVVITGLGALTPVGLDAESSWRAWRAGRSGLGPITRFDPTVNGVETNVAGEVKGFQPDEHFGRREARRMDRVTQLAMAAAQQALAEAGLLTDDGAALDSGMAAPERVGVFIGTGVGGVATLEAETAVLRERGANRVSPFAVPMTLADSVPGAVAIRYGLKGPNMAHLSACASGANAIGEAFEAIRRGAADVMVTGGSEAAITPTVVAGFYNMGALSKWQGEPTLASRPFDARRDGFVIGEGAGVLVLERLEHAQARGARVICELAGYGSTADAVHATAPAEDGDGIVRAIHAALATGALAPEDISYVNAHGTSTPLNDAVETLALKRVLGERSYDVPVSSIKSMIGHLLGAGGAVEAVASSQAIRDGRIPPTINLVHPDPACDLDYVVEGERVLPGGIEVVLSTSLGFGGHNAALVFRAA
jgi:3-oxoacyl-[acyl-carrier-protein] synthase II